MTLPDPQNDLPGRWNGVLSAAQWAQGVQAIGEHRLDELLPLLAETSCAFRDAFIGHLADTATSQPPSGAVLLALARATHDAGRRACQRPNDCQGGCWLGKDFL